MIENPLIRVRSYGQSVWLDFLSRRMLRDGELRRLIDRDGLRGVTSNPSIFESAIDGGAEYDEAIVALGRAGASAAEIYQALVVEDVQRAADLFRACYDLTRGGDGFVSLEVNPHLARDTRATVEEAKRLWAAVDRPNIFIKVPATREGLPAVRELIAGGINVNVTLLFGLPRYREVADAYLSGLEDRVGRGEPPRAIASVASFFLSRFDVLLDPLLEEKARGAGGEAEIARDLLGSTAIACAREAYAIYREIFEAERFGRLRQHGARTQRLLWASTGTKNPAYSDVKYVEPLIGADTVNTLPLKTIEAYRDHGQPAARLELELDQAHRVMESLARLGIRIDEVTRRLEDEGIEQFNRAYDKLLAAIERRRAAAPAESGA
jgi:transaldolase